MERLGTLGHVYEHHMRALSLDPEVLLSEDLADNWLDRRINAYHDIQHVLLGIGTDEAGEIGVAAYAFAQHKDPLNAFALTLLPALLLNPEGHVPYGPAPALGIASVEIAGLFWAMPSKTIGASPSRRCEPS